MSRYNGQSQYESGKSQLGISVLFGTLGQKATSRKWGWPWRTLIASLSGFDIIEQIAWVGLWAQIVTVWTWRSRTGSASLDGLGWRNLEVGSPVWGDWGWKKWAWKGMPRKKRAGETRIFTTKAWKTDFSLHFEWEERQVFGGINDYIVKEMRSWPYLLVLTLWTTFDSYILIS